MIKLIKIIIITTSSDFNFINIIIFAILVYISFSIDKNVKGNSSNASLVNLFYPCLPLPPPWPPPDEPLCDEKLPPPLLDDDSTLV